MLNPAFDLEQLRDHVLDRYDVAYAVTIPDEPASFSILPTPASRPASARRTTTGSWSTGSRRMGA